MNANITAKSLNFKGGIRTKNIEACLNGVVPKIIAILSEIVENPSKFGAKCFQKSSKSGPKSIEMRPWSGFGAKSRPGPLQDAHRNSGDWDFEASLAENVVSRVDFWTLAKSKIAPKSDLWVKTGARDLQKWPLAGGSENT